MKRIKAEIANIMTEQELLDVVFESEPRELIELNVVDPSENDADGVYLEITKLDDYESVVRDRWSNLDGDRHIVSSSDIYAIYRALVEQVGA